MISYGLAALTMLLALIQASAQEESASHFVLDAKVMTAIENGPFVVRATLRYRGDQAIDILGVRDGDTHSYVNGPAHWTAEMFRDVRPLVGAQTPRIRRLNTGDSVTEYLSVHCDYREIPSGTAKIAVTWTVRELNEEKKHPVLANLSQELEVTIERATPIALVKFNERFCKSLENTLDPTRECKIAWAHLRGCRRQELLSLALRLLDSSFLAESDQYRVVSYIYELPIQETVRTNAVVDYLKQPSPNAFQAVFDFWTANHVKRQLPAKEIAQSLTDARNVWVRVLAVAAFGRHIEVRRVNTIVGQLREALDAKPSPAIVSLLTDLDAPRFQVREQATKKLVQMGERVEAAVLQALSKPHSTEAEKRLYRVLKEMEKFDTNPESLRVIRTLERLSTPEALDLLKIIAEGPKGLRSTREANKAIDRLKDSNRTR